MNQIEDLPVRVPRAGRQTRVLTNVTTGLWVPGRKTRRTLTVMITSFVILITVVGSIAQVLPSIVSAFAPAPSSSPNTGCAPSLSNSTMLPDCGGTLPSASTSSSNLVPNTVGAGAVPDLSLPRTVLSSIDNLIGAGGVVQTTADNLTIYNLAVRMRLLGGSFPHDQLLGSKHEVLSSYNFWVVQANAGGVWIPLVPTSDTLTVLGTNPTGTEVVRNMHVTAGPYSGNFEIVYKATSIGPLKWSLKFGADTPGHYRFAYVWRNAAGVTELSTVLRHYQVGYGYYNYTFSWDDVPSLFNVTVTTGQGQFLQWIDVGSIAAGSSIGIDPSVVGSSTSSTPLGSTFQRRVFFDPKGGYYFVFYYDGNSFGYRSSRDGASWSRMQSMPPGFFTNLNELSLASLGQLLVVAWSTDAYATCGTPCTQNNCPGPQCSASAGVDLSYSYGTVSGASIVWQPSGGTAAHMSGFCTGSSCSVYLGMRHVSVALNSTGVPAFAFDWFCKVTNTVKGGYCQEDLVSESDVMAVYNFNPMLVDINYPFQILDRPVVVSAPGGVRVVYQYHTSTGVQMRDCFIPNLWGCYLNDETVDTNVADGNSFSATADANLGIHVVYNKPDGTVSYAYHSPTASTWSFSPNIFSGPASSPTITSDYSTNDVYSFALESNPASSIGMRRKTLGGNWTDQTLVFPVTNRKSPASLSSNIASASATNSSTVQLVWIEGNSSPYNVTFAFIPIQTVWSPYNSPSDPWNGYGLAPYGQYFANLGESVSSSTGMLTVKQTDLSVPGRGLDLAITRIYTEPYSFLNGNPYNYEGPYGFIDDSFSSPGWTLNPPGTFNSDGDIGTITVTASPGSPAIQNTVNIDTSVYPYLVWRLRGTRAYQVGVWIGSTLYKYSPSFDPNAPSSWTTVAWDVRAATGGGVATTVVLWAVGNNGDYVSYDYVGFVHSSVGNGWQLNFPWVSPGPSPPYLHLWDGEGYRIPYSFWTGATASFENHRGENFRFVRNLDGTSVLYTASGTFYSFNSSHLLTAIADSTGNNTISFRYDSAKYNRLSYINDTVGRLFWFYYYDSSGLPMLIRSINETITGSTSTRSVGYVYDGNLRLVSVIGPGKRVTTYSYTAARGAVNFWLLSQIAYPTGWSSNYAYVSAPLGTTAYTYRVQSQLVDTSGGSPVREFSYNYTSSGGDQITGATVASYNATAGQLRLASYTDYAFSFAGMTMNVSDANHQLLRGVQQRFGVNGEIPREIVLVSDGQGHTGSYTNYYRYDLWGDRIYSRRVINPSANWYHESFNAYYNNGLPPGFYAFQDTFSQNQGTATDNPWNVHNGYWMVQNGVYNGTETKGQMEDMFAWTDLNKTDLSISARVYVTSQVNQTTAFGVPPRFGIFGHYAGSGNHKWALVLDNRGTVASPSTYLDLLDEYNQWLGWAQGNQGSASRPCPIATSTWYTFNMTIHGLQAWGNVTAPTLGISCGVTGIFSSTSPAVGGTSFGLYAGGYSALFDNVTVTTVTPFITTTGFSNSFISTGTPGPNIHGALAGTAELQNGTASAPIESYYSYYSWGGLNQQKNRYDPPLLTVDGSAIVGCANYTASCSATLNTSHGNDIIIVYTHETLNLNPPSCSFSVSDTAGLTWASRGPPVLNRYENGVWRDQFQEFWARSTIPLSSDTITETCSGGNGYNGLQVFGISGANLANPFDPNSTLPGSAPGKSAGTSVTISTSNPGDMIIAGVLHGSPPVPTPQTGFNIVTSAGNLATEYEIAGSALTSFAVTFGDTTSDWWEQIVDAVQPSPLGPVTQWLSSSRVYDGLYGNLKTYADFLGNVTQYGYSPTYQNAYLTNKTLVLTGSPATRVATLYSYNFTTGNVLSVTDPMNNVTNYQNDNLGRTTGITYPTYTAFPPAVDGSTQGFCSNTTSSCSVTLSTSRPNDIIIVFASETLDLQTSCTFSVSDTSGLSWTARSGIVYGRYQSGRYRDQLQEWWARSLGILSSDTITESISGCGNSYNGLQVFAISGANFNSPFDPNVGLPGTGSDATSGQQSVTSATISTSNPNDLVFAGVQHGSFPVPTPQSGFTIIISTSGHAAEYEAVNTALTNFAVTFADSTSDYWQEIADAVQPAPAARDFVSYSYNDKGNFVDISNENGWSTRQIYDGLARLSVVDRLQNRNSYSNNSYAYDLLNNVVKQTDPLANSYYYQYDALGRVLSVTKPDQTVTNETYNDYYGWARFRDEYGKYRCNLYDRLGRLISVYENASATCQAGILTTYYYDEVGDLVKVTNANGFSTMYSYDNLGRLIGMSKADGTFETYSYDRNGNVVQKIDSKIAKTLYSYDSLNRPKTITLCGTPSTPVTSTSYTYDKNSNVLTVQNQNATITYTYDSRNRPLSEKYDVNLATRQVVDLGCSGGGITSTTSGGASKSYKASYSYSGEALSGIVYPTTSIQNIAVNYTYDALGRVQSVYSPNTIFAKFSYSTNDQIKGIQYGNGLIMNYTYDSMNRILVEQLNNTSQHTTLLTLAYTYNNTGTVASVIGQINGVAVSEQYKYDALQRLTNAAITSQGTYNKIWYMHDSVGNRLKQSLNGTVTSYLYTLSNNELASSSASGTSTSYSYDPNGNLVSKSVTTGGTVTWTYAWDAANRLLKVLSNGVTQGTYAYDGKGRQVEGVESSTMFYAYFGTETLFMDVFNLYSVDYLYAAGMKIAMVDSSSGSYNTVKYFHVDALGSTRLVTSSSMSVTFADSYQPFGQDNGTPTGSETFKFTGKPFSQTTGLYYYYQRWYDPSIGRFISQDSFPGRRSNPQTLNRYTYVTNTPTTLTDPFGNDGWNPFQAVSNWWNGLSGEQKSAIIIAAVVVVAVVAVVAVQPELFLAEPELLAAEGEVASEASAATVDASGAAAGAAADLGGTASTVATGTVTLGAETTAASQAIASETSSLAGTLFNEADFATPEQLAAHFSQHGADMGFASAEEYLAGARSLLQEGVNGNSELYLKGGNELMAVEPNSGTLSRFSMDTLAIRTFFTPNEGYAYIARQIISQGWLPI